MMRMTMEGTRAPELEAREEDWINTPPLLLRNVAGKIILMDMWNATSLHCLRTLPYLVEWHRRYGDWGLVIIGVHTPEYEFSRSREYVRAAVSRLEIPYPVLVDGDRVNWDNYSTRYRPRKYLIDTDRKIVHDHIGEGGYAEIESAIRRLLYKAHPDAALPEPMQPVRPEDEPGAICYPVTPEVHGGFDRGELGSPEGWRPNVVHTYTDPGKRRDGVLYLRGVWRATPEAVVHGRETRDPEDYVAVNYHAAEVSVVMGPERDAAFDVFVLQDGKPLQAEDRGDDISYAPDGEAYVRVDTPRLYHLVRNVKFGSHEIKLSSTSDQFAVYSFAFGSCKEPE
jgi:thiol-disulfide isomerase/thioredoxin